MAVSQANLIQLILSPTTQATLRGGIGGEFAGLQQTVLPTPSQVDV